ncbi:hypothetical protein [Bacillus rubiinfantis]|uniref:hypothetical protein n=1 Tax=Bacillus rubiinfantis TaxID=1499680 RepID=UPI003CCC541F
MLNRQTVTPFLLLLSSDLTMLRIKVKTKNVRFTIPIPNVILNIGISVLSSKPFQQQLHKWTKEHLKEVKQDFTIPLLEKEMLKPILNELKRHKGLLLVDVKTKDGTEVKIRL